MNSDSKFKQFYKPNATVIYTFVGLVFICILVSILTPYFLTGANLNNVLLQAAVNGIVSVGMTCVIITGGIDLSVGSSVALIGILYGVTFKATDSTALTIIVALVAGIVLGVVNGTLIAYLRMPAFIATLGMMQISRGLSLFISGAKPISGYSDTLTYLGGGYIGGWLSVPVVIMLLIFVIFYFFLRYSRTGRNMFAIGGNMEASRLSGINVKLMQMITYTISGLLCGVAATVLTGRLNMATPQAGNQYELEAIAASVIGGASLAGGRGGMVGTFIGVIIISVIQNGMNLLNINAYLQDVVVGGVILIAVLIDSVQGRRN